MNGGGGLHDEAFVERGNDEEDDPLSFRPRPEAMAPWGEDGVDEATGGELFGAFFFCRGGGGGGGG